jgi:YHS domain-containing protein
MVKGDQGDPEKESVVQGKTYIFAGADEKAKFDKDPVKYMVAFTGQATLPLQPPPPKIMIVGNKGSGVSTQIRMLCDKYKLEEFELQKEYLSKIKLEQAKRQRLRLLKRGYKAMPIDEETGEPQKDDEIVDEPPEFEEEREALEKRFMAEILDSKRGLVIDGNWTTLPEDAVATSL